MTVDRNWLPEDYSPFKTGDLVYQKAAARVFNAYDNRWEARPRRGPFVVDNIYQCGQHIRLSAHGSGLTKIDADINSFES